MADSSSKSLKQILQALEFAGTDISKLLSGDILGAAQGGLQGVREKSLPEQAALNLQLYGQYGPEFNKIGNQIAAQNQQAQAANDLATLTGSGGQLVKGLAGLESDINPELAAAKTGGAATIKNLFDSLDLSKGLSGSERAEVERSINRDKAGTGNEYGSNLGAVQSAMQFGGAGEARMQAKQASVGNALDKVGNFLGTARSGVNPMLALGRPTGTNTGEARYDPGNTGFGEDLVKNMFGVTSELQLNKSKLKSQESIAQRDTLDRINETMGSLGGLLGGAGSYVGAGGSD
ncbi:MAG TPA: hypothetical protein VL854_05705 [Nitrososphaeraceae archaeon]|nr:hypothetical protein [Nitrososphaeraceae archaeon]